MIYSAKRAPFSSFYATPEGRARSIRQC